MCRLGEGAICRTEALHLIRQYLLPNSDLIHLLPAKQRTGLEWALIFTAILA